ncbi:hypothetical protein TNIN_341781 [Trichonephila inaurata madagascariensis]|uniref:Uncharacterized protein n=1 Tax=Trichonephila inaurata madagascariensis TaxID=2747483 RepID=A0A8X7BZZ5_9ARAC|nr:hypothetical protein TNIN_341781 [Trichonephila inaurata madagascariensis]
MNRLRPFQQAKYLQWTTIHDSRWPLGMQEWAVPGRDGARRSGLTSSGHRWVAQLIDENPVVESLQWFVDCNVCMKRLSNSMSIRPKDCNDRGEISSFGKVNIFTIFPKKYIKNKSKSPHTNT